MQLIVIKDLKFVLRLPLFLLFNQSFTQGKFPMSMKCAKVFALHKGGQKNQIDNYRPISLLVVFSKILEKAMNNRLKNFFERDKILYNRQFGFRQGHSTTHAIQQLVGDILNGFEKDFHCVALFLDLRKAFDSCNHTIMLEKLENYGIRGTSLKWIESYLSERTQFVENSEHHRSDPLQIQVGLPQGSIIGPLLMSVMVNDLFKALKLSSCILFADDTTIYLFGKNLHFLTIKMQREIDLVSQWFVANKLQVNVAKTKLMVFSPGKKHGSAHPKLYYSGVRIEVVQTFKFLGVLIDNALSWESHVNHLCKKISKFKFVIRKLNCVLPIHCLRNLYYSYIHSILNYGLIVWGPMLKNSLLDKVEKIQKMILRLINRQPFHVNSSPLFLRNKILKVKDMIKVELLKFIYFYRNNKLPVSLRLLFIEKDHGYSTRNVSTPSVLQHKSGIFNKSFLSKSASLWNDYKTKLREVSTVRNLVKIFKYDCFSNY